MASGEASHTNIHNNPGIQREPQAHKISRGIDWSSSSPSSHFRFQNTCSFNRFINSFIHSWKLVLYSPSSRLYWHNLLSFSSSCSCFLQVWTCVCVCVCVCWCWCWCFRKKKNTTINCLTRRETRFSRLSSFLFGVVVFVFVIIRLDRF